MKRKLFLILILIIFSIYFVAVMDASIEITGYSKNGIDGKYIRCRNIGIITKEECFVDEKGSCTKGFEIEDIKVGDVFITASTHTMGWRHGHSALVVGINPLKTLEAETYGRKSRIIENPVWERYTTFIHLRLKNKYGGSLLAEEAAEYGKSNLTNLEYGILCDKNKECLKKVNCSFIVWKSFMKIGIDIDSNGGYFVIPRDIYNCKYFDVINRIGI